MLTSLVEGPDSPTATGFAPDPAVASPLLVGLLEGIRQLTAEQATRPTLILAGDVLDLALSPDEIAAGVFCGFARLAFGGERPVFDPVVYYLPGNHDHHLWETARESQYIGYARDVPPEEQLIAPWHTTKLELADEAPSASSAWLATLIRREPACRAVEVRVWYPNLALRTADKRRCVIVSHGHFTESIYTMMSRLKGMLYPDQDAPEITDVEVLEQENFAWIDFFWSTLGRSGQVGSDMGMIYADLTSPADLNVLVSNLTASMLAKGKGPKWLHPLEHWALNEVFSREVRRIARSERGTPDVALTAEGQAGLLAYLAGPVRTQLQREFGGVPDEVTFVYGHTHKPFVQTLPMSGLFPSPVVVFNTGGWVVDSATPAPVQAGVAVLINDDLDVAALEFYRQSATHAPTPVRVLVAADEPASSWSNELTARVDAAAEPWASLAVAASRLADQRHRLQQAVTVIRDAPKPPSTARRW
jgi:hypothetical protein